MNFKKSRLRKEEGKVRKNAEERIRMQVEGKDEEQEYTV
jgi:hypothetical protein